MAFAACSDIDGTAGMHATVNLRSATHLAHSPAVALVRDSAGRGGFPLVDFLVAEITAALVTVVSVDVIATFAIVGIAISIGTFSISASLASDIQVITPITIDTPITIHTRIRTTKAILGVDQSGDYRTQHLL